MSNLLSVRQVAFILKVHPLTIRRYIKENKLKAIKVGGNVRIDEKELENLKKEVAPYTPSEKIVRVKKKIIKVFTEDDPFLRLKGRGASLS